MSVLLAGEEAVDIAWGCYTLLRGNVLIFQPPLASELRCSDRPPPRPFPRPQVGTRQGREGHTRGLPRAVLRPSC